VSCHRRSEGFRAFNESTREAVERGKSFLSDSVEITARLFFLLEVEVLPGLILRVVNVKLNCRLALLFNIGDCNKWSDTILSTIDWMSFDEACNRSHDQRHFMP
jgi:hypothetical protein